MKKILLAGVPYHGNIGDSAIYCAERKFIEDNFKDYEFHHISEQGLFRCIDKVAKYYNKEDVIFMHGGGNMGNVYLWHEEIRRQAIKVFKDNKIIIFPQTIHFENNEDAIKEAKKTKDIYNSHKNLTVIAREEESFGIMKEYFPNNNIILTPDIVTYLDKTEPKRTRNGSLLVMRDDKEINMNQSGMEKIRNVVEKNYSNIIYTDTHLRYDKAEIYHQRLETLENKLDEFRKAEIVITDRLHGMIFSAITSTPCIALGNFNHKIESSVKWFESFKYIKFANNVEQVEKYIEELRNLDKVRYDNSFAKEYFKQIIDIVNE